MITIKGTPSEIWKIFNYWKLYIGSITTQELMVKMWGELWAK